MQTRTINEIIKQFNNIKDKEEHSAYVAEITDYLEQCVLSKLSVFISEKRKEKGLSVRDLNERSKVSLAVINDLEKVRSMPRVETLIRLGLALELDFNEVFKALVVEDFTTANSNTKTNTQRNARTNLAMDMSKYGYDKNQISEIMEFIKYVEFKTRQERKREEFKRKKTHSDLI